MVNFKELREKAGLTITDLAEKLSVAESTIYRWESGETTPRLDQFFKFQKVISDIAPATKKEAG